MAGKHIAGTTREDGQEPLNWMSPLKTSAVQSINLSGWETGGFLGGVRTAALYQPVRSYQ